MKTKFLIITVSLLLTSLTFGQKKYLKKEDGQIIDSLTYSKLKDEYVEKIKNIFKTDKIKINENLNEFKKTKDSLIYTFKWDAKAEKSTIDLVQSSDYNSYLGKEFPLKTLKTINNTEISLNDLKGKPTLINFWFTSCKPCIEEMPILNSIKEQFKDKVNFIAITFEPNEKVIAFLKKHKFNFKQITNARKFTDSLQMKSFPVNIFLDKNGVIQNINGGIPYILNDADEMKMGNGDEFIKIIKELL